MRYCNRETAIIVKKRKIPITKIFKIFYRAETTFTTRKTKMDRKPMAANMIPLYKTASLLVHANMSIDRGVDMLKGKFTHEYALISL